MSKTPPGKKAARKPKRQLTPDELQLQKERGLLYRQYTTEVVESMLSDLNRDKIGLMLSGGVDSSIVLWTLLDVGIRPYIYTIKFPNAVGLSTDAKKAKQLADHYDLPFRIVEMTNDKEELAKIIDETSQRNPDLIKRADFEVVPTFAKVYEEARDLDGVRDIFSGIGEGSLYYLGRKNEIKARTGKLSAAELEGARILQTSATMQMMALCNEGVRLGVRLHLPLFISAIMQPYYQVPWHVMHTPVLKAISLSAWEDEMSLSGHKPKVSPLQCGDSGSREYYDGNLTTSKYAADICGRTPTSAQVYYNYLKRRFIEPVPRHEKPAIKDGQEFIWAGYTTEGTPIPKEYPIPVDENGLAPLPPEPEESIGIFGDVFGDEEDKIVLDVDGNDVKESGKEPDRRVDCFGAPFWMGEGWGDEAYRECERAQKGLCSHPSSEPLQWHECEAWDYWTQLLRVDIENIAGVSFGAAKATLSDWVNKMEQRMSELKKSEKSVS